ncbi:MAG: hypothetical protein ACRYFU_07355 [Janthinobacterium lividum]
MPTGFVQLVLRGSVAAALTGVLALSGCGITQADLVSDVPAALSGKGIGGHVHGGVYPIQGATITLMETQTGPVSTSPGYSGTSTYGSAARSVSTTTSDQNGYFNFNTGSWTCNSNEFLYLVVTSGTTTNLASGTMNNNVVQVGVVGPCSETANATSGVVDTTKFNQINVFVSELSTVAAAYALGNFITIVDPANGTGNQVVNIGAPLKNATSASCTSGATMTCTAAGLAHAFTNATHLVYSLDLTGAFPTGMARASNPSSNVSAVPTAMINTLGDILQACVDSAGVKSTDSSGTAIYTASTACSGLFSAATPPNGTAPTNTLQVAMDMAKYPTNNISGLFQQVQTNPPFTPVIDQIPTSWTVSIFYGATANGSFVPYPVDLALDASDAVYVLYGASGQGGTPYPASGTNNTSGAVFALNADGTQLYAGVSNSSLLFPTQIAVSSGGRVYVTNNDTTTAANAGLYATAGSGTGNLSQLLVQSNLSGIALDRRNDVWLSSAASTGFSIYEYPATLTTSTTPTTTSEAFNVPVTGLAIDSNQNVWGITGGSSTLNSAAVMLPNAGSVTSPSYGSTGVSGTTQSLSTYNGFSVALTNAGKAYFPVNTQINSGTFNATTIAALGNPTLSTTSASNAAAMPHRSEVDGAGNVFWTDNEMSGLLYEYTPLSNGNAGTLISLLPCFPFPTSGGLQCITSNNSNSNYTPTNLRGLAIDSAGDIWYAADAVYGTVVETLGLAAPTWPQLSYNYPGCKPGVTITSSSSKTATPPTALSSTTAVCP